MLFKNSNLVFESLQEGVSEKFINEILPHEFNGKDKFIEFYKKHNGICFPDSAEIKLSKDSVKKEYGLEIEFFYNLERINKYRESTKQHSIEAELVTETHFPFGSDASGNDYWLEIPTGIIKYIDWETFGGEKSELIFIASNFEEFCQKIYPLE